MAPPELCSPCGERSQESRRHEITAAEGLTLSFPLVLALLGDSEGLAKELLDSCPADARDDAYVITRMGWTDDQPDLPK